MHGHLCSIRLQGVRGSDEQSGVGDQSRQRLKSRSLGGQDTHPTKLREDPDPEARIVGAKLSFKFYPRWWMALRAAGVSRKGGKV